MSYQAVTWALAQDISHSSAKFVLVVMAHAAHTATWESFMAVRSIAEKTGQDRKTVIANIARLVEIGFLIDTKRRVGETGQIPVYLLNSTENGTVSGPIDESGPAAQEEKNSTEIGTAYEGKSTEIGILEKEGNSTVFPPKESQFSAQESQFSLETVPKTGHGRELLKEKKTTKKKEEPFVLPDWVPVDAWSAFLEMRAKKRNVPTDYAKKLAVNELKKIVDAGEDAETVINRSILKGWAGFFPRGGQTNGKVNKHGGFGNQDYRQGVGEDGSF